MNPDLIRSNCSEARSGKDTGLPVPPARLLSIVYWQVVKMLCVYFIVVATIGISAETEDDRTPPLNVNTSAFTQQIRTVSEQTISSTSEAAIEKSTSATPTAATNTAPTDDYRKTKKPLSKGIDWKDDLGSDLFNTNSKSKRKMIKKLTREREREDRRQKRKQKAEDKRLYMARKRLKHVSKEAESKYAIRDRTMDSNRPIKKTCVECEKRLKREKLEQMRRESLKKQITEKLRLDLSRPVQIPVLSREILRHGIMDDESVKDDDIYATTTDIIIFGVDSKLNVFLVCRFILCWITHIARGSAEH